MAVYASSQESSTVNGGDKLKILIVGAEVSPYANVGGYASVLAYLSRALIRRGHDVRVFMPKFGFIDEDAYQLSMLYEGLQVPTGDCSPAHLVCNIKTCVGSAGVPVYFLENQEYYEKRANVYGYSDDPTRWALLSRAALEFIKTGIDDFVPDVIHCNDWHTGLIPNYLATVFEDDTLFKNISSILTIHNLTYQGNFDHNHVSELDYDDGQSLVASFFDPRLATQNFMRRGIMFADAVNAVSKTYSREILTPEFGEGLDRLLLEVKGKLYGIVNGLDYDEFSPSKDNLIEQNYGINSLELRVQNKKALQRDWG